jgi:16S rRNA (cytosine1402-N4)-methyltransferase
MLHKPVMLKPVIDILQIKAGGVYLDGTFGRGGHSSLILQHIGADGRLLAFDKDIQAIEYGKANFNDQRLSLIHDTFTNFDIHLTKVGVSKIDGVFLDLGVSMMQLLTKERGFSFRLENDLDMRMNNTVGKTAKEWINTVAEDQLSKVLWQYGEERYARLIAKNIVVAREKCPIITTTQLAHIVAQSKPYSNKKHPATKVFQAIRIFINDELTDLELFLAKIPNFLKVGARLAVISFHSLEDRIVKQSFNNLTQSEDLPKWVNQTPLPANYQIIVKKLKPDLIEVESNIHSRSAILRCIEKIK